MQSLVTFENMYASTAPCNTRNLNKRVILDKIRFSGGVSRADLARQMDLTRTAITAIINDLIDVGLVRESDFVVDQSSGGRRPIQLEINPRHSNILGIDMASTHLGIVLADLSGHVVVEVELPFNIKSHPEDCLQVVDGEVRALLQRAGISFEKVIAAGIGVPGPIATAAGGVSEPPIMPGWDGVPIRDILSTGWKIPVALGNDAEFGASGEWAYGAGRGIPNLVYIKVGTGIGSGLLLDGRIYRGATGCAGEIGHMTLQDNGPLCSCGNHGCLEALAGGEAIARQAQEAVLAGKRTLLASPQPVENITARQVGEAARMGDLVAQQIVAEAGRHLGLGIASLVNLFNPNLVVVGGGVSQMGDLLLNPVRQIVRERSLKSAANAVRISSALLNRRSTSIGAVVQATNLALDMLVER